MIPQALVDALRHQVNVTLNKVYGMDCTLFIPTVESYNAAEMKDVFAKPGDYQFVSYSTKVFIEWQPTAYRLKKLGLFVEGNLPIVAWFPTKAIALEGSNIGAEVDIDVVKQSYFEIETEFIPENFKKNSQYEILDPIIKGMQDAVVRKGYSVVPRRVATE